MAKKPSSALHDLFVSLRRVIVLVVTAFALAMEWPMHIVAIRVIGLWAVLVILTQSAEVLFQYLSHRALIQQHESSGANPTGGAASS
ncbi:MAG: hypothetical protein KDB65_03900 [Calditrichaeota bacterium]|nr:hypothetical protein [Calditrichota bacterium]MCB9368805.1 hypothetical protein [Calditrichota bacterium]